MAHYHPQMVRKTPKLRGKRHHESDLALPYHPRADSSLRIFTEISEKIIRIVANRTIW